MIEIRESIMFIGAATCVDDWILHNYMYAPAGNTEIMLQFQYLALCDASSQSIRKDIRASSTINVVGGSTALQAGMYMGVLSTPTS